VNHLLAAVDPPDLARGRYPAPAWLILTVAGVVAALAVGYLLARFRRVDKDKR